MWLEPCVLGFFTTRNSPCGGTFTSQTPRSASLPPGPGNGALPPPVGGTIALSSQARYSGTTLSRGGALRIEGKSLAQWPPFLQGSVRQVPRSEPPTPASPSAEGMRSTSRGLQIPGVGGARPAPALCPPPAPRTRAPACGLPAPPRRPRLPGWSWDAGGAAVWRRGLGGVAGRSGVRQPQPERSSRPLPPQPARRHPAQWRGAARWRRCGGRSEACRSRRTRRRSARAACSASWTTRGS